MNNILLNFIYGLDDDLALIVRRQCPNWDTSQTHDLVKLAEQLSNTLIKEEKGDQTEEES